MKKIIIGNWKLNLDHLQSIQLLQKINYSLPKDVEENIEIVLAPSHTSLRSLQTVISTDNLKIITEAQKFGIQAPFLRPKYLSGDKISDYQVSGQF